MSGSDSISATRLAREVATSQHTLSRWRVQAEGDDRRRGDTDSSGIVELNDAVVISGFLFLGPGDPPRCRDATDSNVDGEVALINGTRTLHVRARTRSRNRNLDTKCAKAGTEKDGNGERGTAEGTPLERTSRVADERGGPPYSRRWLPPTAVATR